MIWEVKHPRADGTFVILLNGGRYHVIQSDPLFPEVSAAAALLNLEPEPPPPVPDLPPLPEPTPAELLARLELLRAQIEALSQ